MPRSVTYWTVLVLVWSVLSACQPDLGVSSSSDDPDAAAPASSDAGPDEPPPPIVVAGARHWVGGNGAFDDAAHWSETSGGAGGASPPSSTEAAIIDDRSESPVVSIESDSAVGRLVVADNAGPSTTLRFEPQASLTCMEDCLLATGRVEQASGSVLAAGRHLDTAAVDLSGSGRGLSIHLIGTGSWRYSGHHAIWNLLAAQPGHTTILRPVGDSDDIDVENQVLLGDAASVLASDTSEAAQGVRAILEIHNSDSDLDIVANGARVEIYSIQHELLGARTITLQTQLDLSTLAVYDVTGTFDGAPGTGPTWVLDGDLDIGGGSLLIEKTATLDAAGFDVHAGSMRVGSGAPGTGTLELSGGAVTIGGETRLGTGPSRPGRIFLDGGLLSTGSLRVQNQSSTMTGPGTVTVTSDYVDEAGANLSFAGIDTIGFTP